MTDAKMKCSRLSADSAEDIRERGNFENSGELEGNPSSPSTGMLIRELSDPDVCADEPPCVKLTRCRSKPLNIGDLVIPAQKLDDPSDGPEVRDAHNFEGERERF
mmetsp:Transcript_64753/g.173698  ORF Transcript_64753/g.173698 Transcript_64753/m.173698 type:complete len:105 (+) Transcript_64753:149-463(+)